MWRSQSSDLTTISLSLFVTLLLQVNWVLTCLQCQLS